MLTLNLREACRLRFSDQKKKMKETRRRRKKGKRMLTLSPACTRETYESKNNIFSWIISISMVKMPYFFLVVPLAHTNTRTLCVCARSIWQNGTYENTIIITTTIGFHTHSECKLCWKQPGECESTISECHTMLSARTAKQEVEKNTKMWNDKKIIITHTTTISSKNIFLPPWKVSRRVNIYTHEVQKKTNFILSLSLAFLSFFVYCYYLFMSHFESKFFKKIPKKNWKKKWTKKKEVKATKSGREWETRKQTVSKC